MSTNEEITTRILSGDSKLVDLTDHVTEDYIKCRGIFSEVIKGRLRIAFVRCPNCREYISVYKYDMRDEKGHTRMKKCICRFQKTFELKNWNKK